MKVLVIGKRSLSPPPSPLPSPPVQQQQQQEPSALVLSSFSRVFEKIVEVHLKHGPFDCAIHIDTLPEPVTPALLSALDALYRSSARGAAAAGKNDDGADAPHPQPQPQTGHPCVPLYLFGDCGLIPPEQRDDRIVHILPPSTGTGIYRIPATAADQPSLCIAYAPTVDHVFATMPTSLLSTADMLILQQSPALSLVHRIPCSLFPHLQYVFAPAAAGFETCMLSTCATAAASNRLVLLASASPSNVGVQKWIYAMSIQPSVCSSSNTFTSTSTSPTPTATTSLPLKRQRPSPAKEDTPQQSGALCVSVVNPHEPSPNPPKCWFCLSSEAADRRLVISVGQSFYLALAKGPLTPHHCLLVPFQHTPSLHALFESQEHEQQAASLEKELHAYLGSLAKMFPDHQLLVSERSIAIARGTGSGGTAGGGKPMHAFLQVIPIPVLGHRSFAMAQKIHAVITQHAASARARGTEKRRTVYFRTIYNADSLVDALRRAAAAAAAWTGRNSQQLPQQLPQQHSPYMIFQIAERDFMICSGQAAVSALPMQFARLVACDLLGLPESMVDWQRSTPFKTTGITTPSSSEADEQTRMADDFRRRFASCNPFP